MPRETIQYMKEPFQDHDGWHEAGWYWEDETNNFGNTTPCQSKEEAARQQERYCKEYLDA